MKPKHTRLGVVITVIVAGLWIINVVSAHDAHKTRNAPASAKKLKNPLKANEKTIAAGQTLYNQYCTSCHGEDGKSATGMAAMMKKRPTDLTARAMRGITDGEIYWVITYGIKKGGMPAFKTGISSLQRWQMTHYVKYLMGKYPALAGGVGKAGQKASAQKDEHADHHANHAAEARGTETPKPNDIGADFTAEKATHKISVSDNGGYIDIVTRDPNDVTSREQIRADLKAIEQKFTAGDFNTPGLSHAKLPSTINIPKGINHLVKYQYKEIDRGGRLFINAADPQLGIVIINFMNSWKNYLVDLK
jgi:mono/diheme cytochrome c family protein